MCDRSRGPIMDAMIAMLTLAAAGMLIPLLFLSASDRTAS